MQLPIVVPAPLIRKHAAAFRDLFENRKQFRHFQNYLTGLIVLPNKSIANIRRCLLDSADKTNLWRYSRKPLGFKRKSTDGVFVYQRELSPRPQSRHQSLCQRPDTVLKWTCACITAMKNPQALSRSSDSIVEAAIRHKVPFKVLLFDGWYLAKELVAVARRHKKDLISILKRRIGT